MTDQIVFPPFRLDLGNEQLWRDNQLVPLRPKAFAVLRCLVEQAGRLVTKEELLKAVWPDTQVSEGILKGYIRDLRDILGDDSQHPRFIETISRRGHRFVAAVTTAATVSSSEFHVSSASPPAPSPQHLAPLLVGRDVALAHLHRLFTKAMRGERQVVFVTGEPGIGKTTLVETFLSGIRNWELGSSLLPSQSRDPNSQFPKPAPWIGRGQCVEQHGAGEPYLPVLEALGRIGRSLDGAQLVTILQQAAPTWLAQMPALLTAEELATLQRRVVGATRERMLREMVEAIEVLTVQHPLVLWFEDLHWADTSTVDWLAAVAQQAVSARLLVIGTYRPSDLSLSGHSLKGVKQELVAKGRGEELWLPFLSAEDVTHYLMRRYPEHQFPPGLDVTIYQRTDGNPLFVVNMVEYLEAQGVIAEVDGHWQLQTPVEEVGRGVPENLRQLIEKHIERLTEGQQRLLEVASIVGVTFSSAAVAAGIEASVEQVEEWCDRLVKRGQFLQAKEPRALPDGTICGSYGFQHALQQAVVYERIPDLRRLRLHRRIGESEEQIYDARAHEIASELAVHFERGQEYEKAAQYHHQAGLVAFRRQANREAIAHFTQGIALLTPLPETPERLQQELQLQVALIAPIIMTGGYAAPGLEHACARARELCQRGSESHQLLLILWRLIGFYLTRAELQTARELGEQLLRLVHNAQDPTFLPAVYLALGQPLFHLGELALARSHLEQSIMLYDRTTYHSYTVGSMQDPGVTSLCYEAWALWFLGYAEQALKRIRTAFSLAQEISHPHELAWALNYAAALHYYRREQQATQEQAEAAIRFSTERGFPFWVAMGTLLRGWALTMQGRAEDGIAQMHQGLATWRAMGAVVGQAGFLAMLAEAQGEAGQAEEGLQTLAEAVALVAKTGDRYYEVEMHRLKGELMLRQFNIQSAKFKAEHSPRPQVQSPKSSRIKPRILHPNSHVEGEAEACFLRALEIARRQEAKSLELRAVMSLVRLRQQQATHAPRNTQHVARNRLGEAHRLLSEVYHWFTEGFDTKDLQDAKALLEELRD
jgi:DNA-binding winged helix-turn-helix (wHTH) protein/predicted ATPase